MVTVRVNASNKRPYWVKVTPRVTAGAAMTRQNKGMCDGKQDPSSVTEKRDGKHCGRCDVMIVNCLVRYKLKLQRKRERKRKLKLEG